MLNFNVLHRPYAAAAASLLIGALGAIYFGTHLTSAAHLNVDTRHSANVKTTVIVPAAKTLPRSQPAQLIIPKIDVDTTLAMVGLKPDGSLDVPADYHIAGWYTDSPTPGELGPSVIDGHVDNHEGLGVFWRLRELTAGDTIQIIRQDSSTVSFRIDSVKQFPQDQFPTNEVYGKINFAGLRLITCGGIFNSDTHHYSDNIVVFASLVQ